MLHSCWLALGLARAWLRASPSTHVCRQEREHRSGRYICCTHSRQCCAAPYRNGLLTEVVDQPGVEHAGQVLQARRRQADDTGLAREGDVEVVVKPSQVRWDASSSSCRALCARLNQGFTCNFMQR